MTTVFKQILITLKCSAATKELIQRAAEYNGQSVSAFVRQGAVEDAMKVMARYRSRQERLRAVSGS